jgi:hypothetical protein
MKHKYRIYALANPPDLAERIASIHAAAILGSKSESQLNKIRGTESENRKKKELEICANWRVDPVKKSIKTNQNMSLS